MTPKITKNKKLFKQLCGLLQRPEVYDIVCALRGPDMTDDIRGANKMKEWTAARLRGLFDLGFVYVGMVNNKPLTVKGKEIIFCGHGSVGYHYLSHYEAACRAFQTLFGYDPAKIEVGGGRS